MESDEVNDGGGGQRARWVEDAESGVSEATNQQANEWVRKGTKRRQSASPYEVALAKWDSLPPLAQLDFAREVVLPLAQSGVRRFGPGRSDLASLAELAPRHWASLGPNFGKAFLERFNKRHGKRQWGIKSDVAAYPERDGNNPSNDPCPNCEHMDCVCLGEL